MDSVLEDTSPGVPGSEGFGRTEIPLLWNEMIGGVERGGGEYPVPTPKHVMRNMRLVFF